MTAKKVVVVQLRESYDPTPYSSLTWVYEKVVAIVNTVDEAKAFVAKQDEEKDTSYEILPFGEEVYVGGWGHAE